MPRIAAELKEERRRAVLEAATACLAADGYAATSMRTIAEAAGMTKGALYAYYPNKDAILLAVAERAMERQLGALEPEPGVSAAARLARLFDGYRRTGDDPEAARAQRAILDLWIHTGHLPAVRAALDERYRRYLGTLTEIVRGAQAEGAVAADADAEHVAGLLLAARDGMVFQRVELGLPVPVPALTEVLRRLVLRDPEM